MTEEKENISIEELMIGFLETSNAQKGTIVLTMLLLQDNEQKQLEMCIYLSENPDADDYEIMKTAYKIAGSECPI